MPVTIDLEIHNKCEVLKIIMHMKEKQLTRFVSDFLEIAPLLAEILPFGAKVMSKWIEY